MYFTFWDFKVVLQKCCHLPNSEFSSLLPVRTHVKVEPSWQTTGKALSVQREEARFYLNPHHVIFIQVFTVWLETMVFTGNHTLTVTCFGKQLCLGNNPSFQHNLVERFLKKGLIIKSCIEWITMLWGLKCLTCWGDLKKLFDVRAICVSLNCQFPVVISTPLFFYFIMSASSWPRCTLCQGEVKTSCILWCEIKYCCASVESWSLFPPRYSRFRESVCKKQVWGVIWYVLRDCAFVCDRTAGVFF